MSSLSPTDTILTASFAAGFCNFSASSIDAFIPVCRWVCGHDRAKVDAKELAYHDDQYLALKAELAEHYGYRKVIEALYNRVDRNASAVSRELTRRLGRHDKVERQKRWSARGSS